MQVVAATTNPHKTTELSRLFARGGIDVRPLPSGLDITIEESGETLQENARLKAAGYAQAIQAWVIADDTGLEVDALHGAPGVRSARFAGDAATMADNLQKLLAELEGVPTEHRRARFVCELAIGAPDGEIIACASGCCHGVVLHSRRGQGGFGYDSLFEFVEYRKTLAELGPVATDVLGHRGIAARRLVRSISRSNWGRFDPS